MKKFLFAALLLLPMAASAETATLHVKGMDCAFCAQKIEASLRENAAVKNVTVDVETGLVTVEGDTLPQAALRQAVIDAGYEVTDLSVQ